MSRCFPYPPPGYTLSRANKDALIESIKLQKEREKAKEKEQRKQDKKREKKERKEEKRERKKEKKDNANQKLDKSGIVRGHISEKLWAKSELLHKGHEAEPDQLERSSLTEEHGHAVCSNPPSCSSDSTENSNKRKRQSSREDANPIHGKIIRIKYSKKPDDSKSSANEQQLCSTSGSAHLPSHPKNGVNLIYSKHGARSTSNELSKTGQASTLRIDGGQTQSTSQQIKTAIATGKRIDGGQTLSTSQQIKTAIATGKRIDGGQTPSTSQQIKTTIATGQRIDGGQTPSTSQQIKTAIATGKTEVPPVKSAVMTPLQKIELQYNSLFEDLALPQLQDTSLPDDLGWLFQGKNQDKSTEKKPISRNVSIPCSGSQVLWPHARYLQEVDVYALPFTVPF